MQIKSITVTLVGLGLSLAAPRLGAQVQIMGKVWLPRYPEAAVNLPPNAGVPENYFGPEAKPDPREVMAISNVRCFASRTGSDSEALTFRTWELAPTGWYRLMGMPGTYTLLYTGPSLYIRPTVVTNMFMRQGDHIDLKIVPAADYAVFDSGAWDSKATDYFQTFVTKSTSITNVGFRVVYDGVDGFGPGSQNLLVSIHKQASGTPDTWEQVGPTILVPDVDSGGAKMYDWSAAWNSGEVPTTPGAVYAVHLRAEKPGNPFQMFWRKQAAKDVDCYRMGGKEPDGFVGRQLWMYVAGDSDGLVIPYNKRVQKEFLLPFAGFAKKWSQTYVAKGRDLAGVLLYAATSGSQPGIHRQRAVVRIHEGGPSGPVVGVQKIATGTGIYTGDASWGTFGAVYAPGEVPLEPGKTYAIEMESIENPESLHGYTNIKGVVSDDKPGFNPYRKHPADKYEAGTAYKNSIEDMGFDLDMQVIEYQHHRPDWAQAAAKDNLLTNGSMEAGELGDTSAEPIKAGGNEPAKVAKSPGKVEAWTSFAAADPNVALLYTAEGTDSPNRFVRVAAGGAKAGAVDGGFVQRVTGLHHNETYRLEGKVRCSWPMDMDHACMIGYDPTGQDSDPKAPTIVWSPMVGTHSVWSAYNSDPVRPSGDAVSVWLRGWSKSPQGYPFKADFDDFGLRRVQTGVPTE